MSALDFVRGRSVAWRIVAVTALALAMAASGVVGSGPALAWEDEAAEAAEGKSAIDLNELLGKKIRIQLKTGKSLDDAEVVKTVPGSEPPGSIRSLTVKIGTRSQIVAVTSVAELHQDGQPLDVEYDKRHRVLVHSPERRRARLEHLAEVKQRLAGRGLDLWSELSDEDHSQHVAEHKEFLKSVSDTYPNMQLYETKYYLFCTDMPAPQIAPYIAYLDGMYDHLIKAFGIDEGKNIWLGKCVVVCFVEQPTFMDFERRMMNNSAPAGVQGLCHSYGNGKVVISCYRGSDPAYFAGVLVHETAHGFVHRFMSPARIPSWINEGISDWVAAAIVKADDGVKRRQRDAITRIRQTNSLGGDFFEAEGLQAWQYGAASSLVEFMLRTNGPKYRELIVAIKEGHPVPDALKMTYGLTFQELAFKFGQALGAANVRP